jgi:hypothetical protein
MLDKTSQIKLYIGLYIITNKLIPLIKEVEVWYNQV